jgi:glycylpeptide N-tetradecanoyltransferase
VQFSFLARNMTMQRTIKLYRLPEQPKTPGFRKLKPEDCPQAFRLLYEVQRFSIRGVFFF